MFKPSDFPSSSAVATTLIHAACQDDGDLRLLRRKFSQYLNAVKLGHLQVHQYKIRPIIPVSRIEKHRLIDRDRFHAHSVSDAFYKAAYSLVIIDNEYFVVRHESHPRSGRFQ